MSDSVQKLVQGRFEPDQNILHLWFPEPVRLTDADTVKAFFDEVVRDWIEPTPGRFYLLVNYEKLHIAAQVAVDYGRNIERFQHRLLGTYRYSVPGDFTGVAVSLGNLQLKSRANMFENESAAREAIDRARRGT